MDIFISSRYNIPFYFKLCRARLSEHGTIRIHSIGMPNSTNLIISEMLLRTRTKDAKHQYLQRSIHTSTHVSKNNLVKKTQCVVELELSNVSEHEGWEIIPIEANIENNKKKHTRVNICFQHKRPMHAWVSLIDTHLNLKEEGGVNVCAIGLSISVLLVLYEMYKHYTNVASGEITTRTLFQHSRLVTEVSFCLVRHAS